MVYSAVAITRLTPRGTSLPPRRCRRPWEGRLCPAVPPTSGPISRRGWLRRPGAARSGSRWRSHSRDSTATTAPGRAGTRGRWVGMAGFHCGTGEGWYGDPGKRVQEERSGLFLVLMFDYSLIFLASGLKCFYFIYFFVYCFNSTLYIYFFFIFKLLFM